MILAMKISGNFKPAVSDEWQSQAKSTVQKKRIPIQFTQIFFNQLLF
jgi:hypothetical protein